MIWFLGDSGAGQEVSSSRCRRRRILGFAGGGDWDAGVQGSSMGEESAEVKTAVVKSSRIGSSWSCPSISFPVLLLKEGSCSEKRLSASASGAESALFVTASVSKKSSDQRRSSRLLRMLDLILGNRLSFDCGASSGGDEGKAVPNAHMSETMRLTFILKTLTTRDIKRQEDSRHDSCHLDQISLDLVNAKSKDVCSYLGCYRRSISID